ncbi:MAG: DsrE family protein [Fimbriimonadaceae bacterium]
MQKKILWILSVVALLTIVFTATGLQSAPKRTLFLNLTTSDAWTNEMALSYGKKVLELGHDVVVFLNVRAVEVARKEPPADLQQANKDLAALQAMGARVFVCGACSRRAGLKVPDDWMDGVRAGGDETIRVQMAPDTSVLSY